MRLPSAWREPKWFIDDLRLILRHGWRQALPGLIGGVLAALALKLWFEPELQLIGAIESRAIALQESQRIFRTAALGLGLVALPTFAFALREWWQSWSTQAWPPTDRPMALAQRRLHGRAARTRSLLVLFATALAVAGLISVPLISMHIVASTEAGAQSRLPAMPEEVAAARVRAAQSLAAKAPVNARHDELVPILFIVAVVGVFALVLVSTWRKQSARDQWLRRPLAPGEQRFPVVVQRGSGIGGLIPGFQPGVLSDVDGKLLLTHFAVRDAPETFPLMGATLVPVRASLASAAGPRRFAVQSSRGQHQLMFQWRSRDQDWDEVPAFVAAHAGDTGTAPAAQGFSLLSRHVSSVSVALLLLLLLYVIAEAAGSTHVWLNDDLAWVYAAIGTVVIAVAGLGFLVNSMHGVPKTESLAIAIMLAFAAGAATLPVLKRIDTATAEQPLQVLRYRMLEPGVFEPVDAGSPSIDERARIPFWNDMKRGDEYQFTLQLGGLGLWQHERLALMQRNGARAQTARD